MANLFADERCSQAFLDITDVAPTAPQQTRRKTQVGLPDVKTGTCRCSRAILMGRACCTGGATAGLGALMFGQSIEINHVQTLSEYRLLI